MKKHLIGVIAISFLFVYCNKTGIEDSVDIPDSVTASFAEDHPGSSDVEWELEGSNFEVEYEEDDIEKESLYSSEGVELELEIEISFNDLPGQAITYVETNYPSAEIEEVEQIITNENTQYFEVELELNEDEEIELLFDESGVLLSTEIEEDDDEDEDED